ncbi:MAG: Gfo/Idh/MocA family oxidoreductase [Methylacidiphilales bacterium]|nr:Gfo/Idh/MocA family oxidoreductase [Candidatus Methylacidiphilales bacterium]MDW8349727.1 Gfo/Idh/MocA family oxidoreductase [Verrucomicrobiae bacterium]
MKVRVGVIGVGHIGKEHVRIYAGLPGAELVGIYDLDRERAERVGARYRVKVFSDCAEMWSNVDAVSIASVTSSHYPIGKEALQAGKHVLVEKPITDNPGHARELVELASERGLVLQVGHVERYNPAFKNFLQYLTQPRFIEAHRLSPYPERSTEIGVVLDLMIHDLDIILHIVRSPITLIDAVGVPVLSRDEDIANVRLRFANGCVANVTTSRISREKLRKIRVFQSDAYLSLDYQNQEGEIYRKKEGKIIREKIEVHRDEPLKLELESFIECVRFGRKPVVSGVEGMNALELAIEITRRIQQTL